MFVLFCFSVILLNFCHFHYNFDRIWEIFNDVIFHCILQILGLFCGHLSFSCMNFDHLMNLFSPTNVLIHGLQKFIRYSLCRLEKMFCIYMYTHVKLVWSFVQVFSDVSICSVSFYVHRCPGHNSPTAARIIALSAVQLRLHQVVQLSRWSNSYSCFLGLVFLF